MSCGLIYNCVFRDTGKAVPWHECRKDYLRDSDRVIRVVLEEREKYGLVSDVTIRQLAKGAPFLTTLSLKGCSNLSEKAFEPLQGMNVTDLHISSSKINDEGLRSLSALPLEKLSLEQCEEITNEGIKHLNGIRLTTLAIDNCPLIDDNGLLYMFSRFKITHLSLIKCKITLNFFRVMKNFSLQTLDLHECNSFDFPPNAQIKCDSLKSFKLNSCASVSNNSMLNVKFENLSELEISGCPKVMMGKWMSTFAPSLQSLKIGSMSFEPFQIHTFVQCSEFLPDSCAALIAEYAKGSSSFDGTCGFNDILKKWRLNGQR